MTLLKHTKRLVAVVAALALSSTVFAHTTSLGTFNAGSPGSVSIVIGSYHGSGVEGFIQLIGGPGTPIPGSPTAFDSWVTSKPSELVDGVNNFYGQATFNTGTPGQYDQSSLSGMIAGYAPTSWQIATFSGLTAGTYTYQISGMYSDRWRDWNANIDNWTGTVVITSEVVNGVPDGGLTAMLLGLPMLALAARRRRQS